MITTQHTVDIQLDKQFVPVLEKILQTKGFIYRTRPLNILPDFYTVSIIVNCEPGELAQFGFITGFQVAMTLQVEHGLKIQMP